MQTIYCVKEIIETKIYALLVLVLQLHLLDLGPLKSTLIIQLLVEHMGGRLEHQVEHQPYMFEVLMMGPAWFAVEY